MAVKDDLRFGSQRHQMVLDAILSYRDFSREKMQGRYEQWRECDEAFIAYMPEKDADRRRRKELKEKGEPQFLTLKIPFDYAVLMSFHTYATSVFLGRNPVMQYQGRSGQGQSGHLAIEALIDYQVQVGRMLPNFYVWLLDTPKYGVGIVGDYWWKEQHSIITEVEVPEEFLGVDLGTTRTEQRQEVITSYMGNKLYNVRPYDAVPDPRVTFTDLQSGEFFGRHTQLGWNRVVKGQAQGQYFNVEHIARATASVSRSEYGSPQVTYPVRPGEESWAFNRVPARLQGVELLEMYIELIPREWGLADRSYPEKWAFAVANDACIIAAQPLGLYHNRFPFAALEAEPDGYSIFKRSLLETVGPMTDVLTWLFNSHFYNTRKALNDMFIVDPSKVVLKDLLDPKPGKLIRLKEEMYGQDVRSAVTQFSVNDVTAQHMQDAQAVSQLIQRVSGVNDNIMGLVNAGGRKTATEVRTSSTFGINRLKTTTEWFSATGFNDLSQLLVQTTQQLMDEQLKVRIAGDALAHPGAAESVLQVGPRDIAGFWDFMPVDGTLPVDRFAQVNMWGQLLQQMSQAPAVLAEYDLGKIFAFVANLAGLKNINQFKIQMASQQQLAAQAQAGNVVPLRGGDGQQRGSTRPRATGEAPVPNQTPGVGVAG